MKGEQGQSPPSLRYRPACLTVQHKRIPALTEDAKSDCLYFKYIIASNYVWRRYMWPFLTSAIDNDINSETLVYDLLMKEITKKTTLIFIEGFTAFDSKDDGADLPRLNEVRLVTLLQMAEGVQEQTVALKPHQRCGQAFWITLPSPSADMTNTFCSVQTLLIDTTGLLHYLNTQRLPPMTVYQHSVRVASVRVFQNDSSKNEWGFCDLALLWLRTIKFRIL